MSDFLTKQQVKLYRELHRQVDASVKDRIKAILMLNTGYTYEHIAEVLLLDDSTIRRWHRKYEERGLGCLISDDFIGGTCKLTLKEQQELTQHLEENVYLTAKEICSYVEEIFKVVYTVKGMISLLHHLNFSYKKPKHIPGKANIEAQLKFIETYNTLNEKKEENDKIYFMDGVHPLHNSQPAYGWIRKGVDMALKSNTGRARLNLNGAYNIDDHSAVIQEADSINAQSTVSLLEEILRKQPLGVIYIILDNARYYRSRMVQEFVEKNTRIRLMFLPPYSPNLNVIERLWKFFKKNVTYNKYYEKYAVFREHCLQFFKNLNKYRVELETLMTDNFQLIQA
ncbi:MAG: IS630 family transposase [Bacteroidetes bacterium]|nr:IS630 family transposase [Bacteroidota bacterium]